jgi:hypothetical protein
MSIRLLDKDKYFQLLVSSTVQRVPCGEVIFDAYSAALSVAFATGIPILSQLSLRLSLSYRSSVVEEKFLKTSKGLHVS